MSITPVHRTPPLPDTEAPAPPVGPVDAARRRAVWWTVACAGGAAALLALDYRSVSSTVAIAVTRALAAPGGWLLTAVGSAVCSVLAFGMLRRLTIRAAGGQLSTREAIAVSYAAGAVHLTIPGGALVSTAYAFRRMRRSVAPSHVAWSLAMSGVLSLLALVLIGVVGLVTGGRPGQWSTLLPACCGAAAAVIVVTAALRRPDAALRMAVRGLGILNRLLRRPADAGAAAMRRTVGELLTIRPRPGSWPAPAGAAVANWLLDLLCLWVCAHALGIAVTPWSLLGAYALAMAGASVSPTPGGVGLVDGVLVLALTRTGAPIGTALGTVLLYRVIALGTLIAGGWAVIGLGQLRRSLAAVARGTHSRCAALGSETARRRPST